MTTPFSPATTQLAGADPGEPQFWRTDAARFWLGKPETMMVELPSPDPAAYTAPGTTGQVIHGLMGGGSAMTRFDSSMRAWSLSWPRLAGRDWQVVNGFDRHLFGADPLIFLPPEDVNRLTLQESLCGALEGVVKGWIPSAGPAPTYQATIAPYSWPGGVMQWAPGASGRVLAQGKTGTTAGTPDTLHAAPYLPAMPITFSIRVRALSGVTSAQVRLSGRTAAGAVVAEATSATLSVSSASWALLYVTALPGTLGASQYVLPEVVSTTTATLNLCNPQTEYADLPSDWCAGAGAPRVLTSTAGLGRAVDVFRNSAATLTLLEAVTGAA